MRTFALTNAQQAHEALQQLWMWLKPRLIAGHAHILTVEEDKRTSQQNRLLHALLQDISQRREWAGQKWDVEVWKRLLVAAWTRANKEPLVLIPALDGQGVDIVFRRTSKMTKAEVADLIDFITAWDATNESVS